MILSRLWAITGEVILALTPLVVFFLLFQLVYARKPWSFVRQVLTGTGLAAAGLILFLWGVQVGFMPVAREMGAALAALQRPYLLMGLGFLFGLLATIAEPAVWVLCGQVERASAGYIPEKLMLVVLSLGVGLFVALGMGRVSFGWPLYYLLLPGYILAIILIFFSKPTFIAVAFDAGAVVTGPMIVTFVMALVVGIAGATEGRDPILDGFGLVALVALAPILSVMILGLFFERKE